MDKDFLKRISPEKRSQKSLYEWCIFINFKNLQTYVKLLSHHVATQDIVVMTVEPEPELVTVYVDDRELW